MKTKQTAVLICACVITVALRFAEIPLSNFGSMAALALLCGATIRHPAGLLIPLGIRLLTDVLIHLKTGHGFFENWPFDYSAYVLIFFVVGRYVVPNRPGLVVGGSLATVAIYFLTSNFGFWYTTDAYPSTFAGLMSSYTMAIPFIKGTFVGNMLFGPAFFAAWNFATASDLQTGQIATSKD